ncbi:MAG: large conductance mechanosensitive channel protein MscL [Coriobacteriia bacterium]
MWKEFKEFAFKGNVIDLAIGIVLGAAFGAVVTSFVTDLINPLIGLIGGDAALEKLSVSLTPTISLTYGAFLSAILNFLIIAFALFLIVKAVNRFRKAAEVTERPCPYCLTAIPKAASRCPSCTSEVTPE